MLVEDSLNKIRSWLETLHYDDLFSVYTLICREEEDLDDLMEDEYVQNY